MHYTLGLTGANLAPALLTLGAIVLGVPVIGGLLAAAASLLDR